MVLYNSNLFCLLSSICIYIFLICFCVTNVLPEMGTFSQFVFAFDVSGCEMAMERPEKAISMDERVYPCLMGLSKVRVSPGMEGCALDME